VQGLMHSDELPAYGISNEETKKIHQLLECKDKDAFVLIFGEKNIAEDAIGRVIERIKVKGVPKEVRRVTPDGLTRFLRPMPGASRMYPETDIPPMKLTNIKVKTPKTLDQRENEMPLNDEESKQIVSRNLDYKFRNFMKYYEEPKTISRLLLHTLPNLKTKNEKIIKEEAITKVLKLVKEGKIAKEGIEDALIQANRGKDIRIRNENIEEEVVKFVDKLINEKNDFIKQRGIESIGPLMGPVMAKFRGEMDGAKINALLIKKIKENI